MMPNMRQRELKEVWNDPFNPVASPFFRECPGPVGALDPILATQRNPELVSKEAERGNAPAQKAQPVKS